MKKYSRKQITHNDLETYTKCPEYYRLSKDEPPSDITEEELFQDCVKSAIIHAYTIELTTGNRAEFHSVKSYFNKLFWKRFASTDAVEALKLCEQGSDILYSYYDSIYSVPTTMDVAGVRAPHEILLNDEKLGVPTELPIVMVDSSAKEVYLVGFIDKPVKNIDQHVRASLKHNIQLISIYQEAPEGFAVKATFYSINGKISGTTLDLDSAMINDMIDRIKFLTLGIDKEVYYMSKSEACKKCEHYAKCNK